MQDEDPLAWTDTIGWQLWIFAGFEQKKRAKPEHWNVLHEFEMEAFYDAKNHLSYLH